MITEIEHFMNVFEEGIGDLDDEAFTTCEKCGRTIWNRMEPLCKRCEKQLSESLNDSQC